MQSSQMSGIPFVILNSLMVMATANKGVVAGAPQSMRIQAPKTREFWSTFWSKMREDIIFLPY
jgi:hypothetical protein